jgi:hypothetical protein
MIIFSDLKNVKGRALGSDRSGVMINSNSNFSRTFAGSWLYQILHPSVFAKFWVFR